MKGTGFCYKCKTFCILKTTIYSEGKKKKRETQFFCGSTYNSLKENIKVP